jgi:ribosomal protein S18 acetylase RimI-like enzyme
VRFRIREFHKNDFEQLWTIDQECFPPGISYTRIELAFYMRRPRAFTLVAESEAKGGSVKEDAGEASPQSGGVILGFIVGEATTRGAGHIITIDVRREARRGRVGSTLLQAAEEHLRGAGARHVLLETAVNNGAAISFYKRHGYELIKTIPRYYKSNLDALLLGKKLQAAVGS